VFYLPEKKLIKFNNLFNFMKNFKTIMVKVTVKEGWTDKSKLAIIGMIGGMLAIIAVIALD
jgi:hypothetical protein